MVYVFLHLCSFALASPTPLADATTVGSHPPEMSRAAVSLSRQPILANRYKRVGTRFVLGSHNATLGIAPVQLPLFTPQRLGAKPAKRSLSRKEKRQQRIDEKWAALD